MNFQVNFRWKWYKFYYFSKLNEINKRWKKNKNKGYLNKKEKILQNLN